MIIVGLCGGSGSGKGAVSAILNELGFPTVDTDSIYHDITSHPSLCLSELSMEFGTGIIRDGALDRRALASIVFGEDAPRSLLDKLNAITHKHVLSETRRIIDGLSAEGHRAVFVDVPLMFESGFDRECDVIVSVTAPIEKRIERITLRDNISREEAVRRIASQRSDEWLKEHSDHVIENCDDLDSLRRSVNELIIKILR
ncbi:MAG: dephospho-CoA kinase [Clostridia bacterium]|nr:dephospho-CoA kinase [Clostridia bacterium]